MSTDDLIDRSSDSPIVQILNYDDQPSEIIYRASSVGSCPRKLWAARNNNPAKPVTAKMQAIFDRGHELEPIILNALIERGWELRNYQGEVLFKVFDLPSGAFVSVIGHYDCEARYPIPDDGPEGFVWSEWLPCDVKGFGPDLVSEYLAHGIDNLPHYQWQQSIYVIGHPTAKSYLMPVWDKDKGELLSSSLYPRLPDITLADIEQKLMSIEQSFLMSQMPDCTNEYPCPYYYLHDDKPSPPDTLPESAVKFVIARQNADRQIKRWTTAKDAMTAQLVKLLPDNFKADHVDGDNTYHISIQPNPSKFNTNHAKDVLTEAGFDLTTDEFTTPGKGNKLVITDGK
jgi:hypothetical protein